MQLNIQDARTKTLTVNTQEVVVDVTTVRSNWAAQQTVENYEELMLRSEVQEVFAEAQHGFVPTCSDEHWAQQVQTLASMVDEERLMREENLSFFAQFS